MARRPLDKEGRVGGKRVSSQDPRGKEVEDTGLVGPVQVPSAGWSAYLYDTLGEYLPRTVSRSRE